MDEDFGTRDSIGGLIDDAASALFRISIVKRVLDTGLAFLQAYGHGDPDDAQNQELLQEADIDHVQHFGFASSPPIDTDAVVAETDAGLACIAERYNLQNLGTHGGSSQIPDTAVGDTCIYASDGAHIFIDASTGKLTLRTINGNIEAVTGSYVLLGTASATKFIALAQDVVTELQAIRDFFDTHVHTDPQGGSTGVPTVLFTAQPAVGDCASTKVKAT